MKPAFLSPSFPSLALGIAIVLAPALRGQEAPETDGREGLHSLEILVATYLSARDGRKVALPLEY